MLVSKPVFRLRYLLIILVVIVGSLAACGLFHDQSQVETRTFNEIVDAAKRGDLLIIIVKRGNSLRVFFKDGLEVSSFAPAGIDLRTQLAQAGVPENILTEISIRYE